MLALCFGALGGLVLAFIASRLIEKINLGSTRSDRVLSLVGCVGGSMIAFLILRRFDTIALRFGYAVLCAGLLIQSMVDFYTHRLVRQITHGTAIVGVATLGFASVRDDTVNSLFVAAVCAVAGVVLALITTVMSRNSLGAGDVRLTLVLGWFSRYVGYDSAVLTLFFSSVFAAMFGLILVVFRHATWRHQIAFGPFLTLGALFVIFAGEN
ncbi:MAG: prepilin peptidase, partial [Actinomycetota bacterium]